MATGSKVVATCGVCRSFSVRTRYDFGSIPLVGCKES